MRKVSNMASTDTEAKRAVNELKRAGAAAQGKNRSEQVSKKIAQALLDIDKELSSRCEGQASTVECLTLASLCKRAGVAVGTLYGKKHAILKGEVDEKLEALREKHFSSPRASSELDSSESESLGWKELYDQLAADYSIDALRWRQERALRETAQQDAARLMQEILGLNQLVASLKGQISALTQDRAIPPVH